MLKISQPFLPSSNGVAASPAQSQEHVEGHPLMSSHTSSPQRIHFHSPGTQEVFQEALLLTTRQEHPLARHQACKLKGYISSETRKDYKWYIKKLEDFLKENEKPSLSELIKPEHQEELKKILDENIKNSKLHPSTRAAVNDTFGFSFPRNRGSRLTEDILNITKRHYKLYIKKLEDFLKENEKPSLSELTKPERQQELENIIDENIRNGKLYPRTRAAVNDTFGFSFRGSRRSKLTVDISDITKQLYKWQIKKLEDFLRENKKLPLSELTKPEHQQELKNILDENIKNSKLSPNTRGAVNEVFGCSLTANRRRKKAEGVSDVTKRNYTFYIKNLEDFLNENEKLPLLELTKPEHQQELKQILDENIRNGKLHCNTRAAINDAFGFSFTPNRYSKPTGDISNTTKQGYKRYIKKFEDFLKENEKPPLLELTKPERQQELKDILDENIRNGKLSPMQNSFNELKNELCG